jgi:D-sedoheptulose 7-phosphate isomerase/D-glycero-D-manno-heptose 1,7-bisphosphate phosphatase
MTTVPGFPAHRYVDAADYLTAYADLTMSGWQSIDHSAVRRAAEVLLRTYTDGREVFVCGNGGSAAIADHLECDHVKGVSTGTELSPHVRSLAANVSLLTAIANDFAYDEVFAFPLVRLSRAGDVLLTISSSGNSPNIIKAIECALARGLATIALTGFDGGAARQLAEISIHVDVANYGVVEDIHQGIIHVLAQYLRQSRIDPADFGTVRF